jgi:hypothetical protein
MSAIFYHDEEQKKSAMKTRDLLASKTGKKIYTQIQPADTFYLAEAYHQKHALRGHTELVRLFKSLYTKENDFVNATAVARANGIVGGYGKVESLERELKRPSIPSETARQVLRLIQPYNR